MAHRLEGWTAIRYAEKHGGTLKKFSDPTERALKRVSIKKAQRVAHEDARLIYMDVPHANNWRKRNPRRIDAIVKTGARNDAELHKLWKYQDKRAKIADERGTKAYMNRMDAPSYTAGRRRNMAQGRGTYYEIRSAGRQGEIIHATIGTLEAARRRAQSDANSLGESVWIMRMRGAGSAEGKYVETARPQKRNAGGTSTARAARGVTLRNMASVTIKRLPGGAVAVTGRKLAG